MFGGGSGSEIFVDGGQGIVQQVAVALAVGIRHLDRTQSLAIAKRVVMGTQWCVEGQQGCAARDPVVFLLISDEMNDLAGDQSTE